MFNLIAHKINDEYSDFLDTHSVSVTLSSPCLLIIQKSPQIKNF